MNRLQATVLAVHALFWAARAYAQSDMPVYADALESGWENWSWAATASSAQFVHSGAVALSIQAQAWQAAYFHHAALDASQFTNLVFWINGGPQGAQRLLVQGVRSGAAQSATNLPPLQAKTWAQFTIPLSALGLEGTTDFDGFWIQDRSGSTQPAFYLDDIRLVGASQGPPATNAASVTISVDAQRQRQPISPLIYGVAFASASQLRDLNAPLNRSGGNAESRYNWQINAHNRGADWYFESLADDPATPGAA